MAVKDYFKFFSKDAFVVCYVVKFKNDCIDINNYAGLKKDVQWSKFGENSYHAYCELTKENLIELICKEIGIESNDITVINSSELSGIGF
ncbi:hypothetical protein UT300003_17500 [Clostridium sardiniense]|uniref:hypothetical protein n=1 Tax=Clostridium sardiniense TaxID=29369 RepID=UPI00195DAB29|nr:hypothetical protein [Clostridium sardiniense]MBM7833119.1 hypothetical protein [Clostridium sardiniense]